MFRDRREYIIFFVSLAVKLAFFLCILWFFGSQKFYYSDSWYLTQGENLWKYGTFSSSLAPPHILEAVDTPGYPAFLALTLSAFQTVFLPILLQIFLVSFAALFLYRMLEGIFPERVRFWGAIVFAVEPWNVFVANVLLSESLFLFFFVLGLYWLKESLVGDKFWAIILGGISLSMATMVRPVILYLLPVLIIVFFAVKMFEQQENRWRVLGFTFVFIVAAYSLVSLWSFRNYVNFGSFTFANKGPWTLYFYDAEQLLIYRDKISPKEADTRLFELAKKDFPEINSKSDLKDPKFAPYFVQKTLEIIKEAPLDYAKLHLISVATFFLSDGYRLLLRELEIVSSPLPNLSFLIFSGGFADLLTSFKDSVAQIILFIVGFLFWAGVTLSAVAALPLAYLRKETRQTKLLVAIFLIIIFYFALVTGPAAQARYRVQITPFLFPLAFFSFFWLKDRFAANKKMPTEGIDVCI